MLDTNSRALLATASLVPAPPPGRGGRSPTGPITRARAARRTLSLDSLLRGRMQKTGPRVDSRLSTDGAIDQDPPKRVQDPRSALRLLGTLIRVRVVAGTISALSRGAFMRTSFLSSTSVPSAHESPGARVEHTHLWARSKCKRVQRSSIWCDGVG